MIYTLLRLLFFSLCCEAVRNKFHWKETKTTFTTNDYHSNASYRNVHHNAHSQRWHAAYDRAVNRKAGSWTQTTIATASWDAVRPSQDHNALVAETTQRAMRKTGAPNRTQSVRSEGYGNVTERMNGKLADDTKPYSGGRTHLGGSAGYVQRGHRTRAHVDTRTSHSRQRRNAVRGRELHREMSQAAKLSADTLRDPTVILEPLPHAMAQERGPDFLFNESSDYDPFTHPDIDDSTPFVPVNTQTRRKQLNNPFYPLTAESYGAYAVTVVAVIIFTVGIIGNMAIMCIVCHNYYMRSISNSLLANLALWDFVIIFFCLPLVVFHELTKDWLLGAFSCKIIPYLEVASLGVTTFTLCALCIDRFRAASNVQLYYEMVENCASTAAKMAVIWVGALLLALPELLIRQLAVEEEGVVAEGGSPPGGRGERCAVRVSTALPDTLYVLGLTYDGARLWWHFGCYFCLPTLFTIGCSLATARRIRAAEQRARSGVRGGGNRKQVRLESQMNCAVVALAILYGCCVVPENICNVLDAYMAAGVAAATLDALRLVSQLLLFAKSAATPVLLCCLCQPFAGAFLDCCCCCLGECAPTPATSDPRPHAASDNEDECTTTELELSPFNTARRDAGARAY